MRHLFLLSWLLALLHAGVAKAQGTSSWQSFTSPEGCFTVLLPSPPVETIVPGPKGGRKFAAPVCGRSFHVRYDAGVPAAAGPADLEKALDAGEAVRFADGRCHLLARKKLSLGKYPGREFTMRIGDYAHARCRLFVVESRLYAVWVEGLQEHVSSAEADAFLDSFRISGPVPAPVPAAKPPPLQPFTSREGRFTVLLPGKPVQKQIPMPPQLGPGVYNQFGVQVGDFCWMVTYNDFPFAPADPQHTMSQAVKGVAGTVLSDKVLPGKVPGREVLFRLANLVHMRARYFVVGRRLYQVIVGGTENAVKSPDVDPFFDSFSLLK